MPFLSPEDVWDDQLYNTHNFVNTWLFLTNLVPFDSPVLELSIGTKMVKNDQMLRNLWGAKVNKQKLPCKFVKREGLIIFQNDDV